MKNRTAACCLSLLLGLLATACSPVNDPVQVIPKPFSVEMGRGTHTVETELLIHFSESQRELAEYLSSFFKPGTVEADEIRPSEMKKISVVFMGNSITQSWSRYSPGFFEENNYKNRGISGQTTPQMLARFGEDVIRLKPDVVVILAGTNDIAGNTGFAPTGMIMDNIISMAELSVANEIKVVLCSVLPAEDYPWNPGQNPVERIPELNGVIEAYALENGHAYVDFFTPMANEGKGLKRAYSEDGVHPNEEGYRVMEPLVQQGIRQALQNE